jgi:hypothetical protein
MDTCETIIPCFTGDLYICDGTFVPSVTYADTRIGHLVYAKSTDGYKLLYQRPHPDENPRPVQLCQDVLPPWTIRRGDVPCDEVLDD